MSSDLRGSGLMRARLSYRTAAAAAVLLTFSLLLEGSALAATITSFSPASGLPDVAGICPGGVVAIAGTGFADERATGAAFNGVPAATFSVGSNIIAYATVPKTATSGKITITTSAGTATSATDFTVLTCWSATEKDIGHSATPVAVKASVAKFAPVSGKAGTKVTITGTNLTTTSTVKFAGVKASFKVVSPTKITATVPAKAKTGKITVTTGVGTAIGALSFTVK
jgi:hypothetical protein